MFTKLPVRIITYYVKYLFLITGKSQSLKRQGYENEGQFPFPLVYVKYAI